MMVIRWRKVHDKESKQCAQVRCDKPAITAYEFHGEWTRNCFEHVRTAFVAVILLGHEITFREERVITL